MLSWLVEAGFLAGKARALSRHKRHAVVPQVNRFLPVEHRSLVLRSIEAMPVQTRRERLQVSRCRWLFSLLYRGGLRISEVCGTTMGAFFRQRSVNGSDRWWLEITGKGGKRRLVPVTGELMARSAVHVIVKEVVHQAAASLRHQGPAFEPAAAHIEQASAPWMRHTAGSHLSELADLKGVRDNLGHTPTSAPSASTCIRKTMPGTLQPPPRTA